MTAKQFGGTAALDAFFQALCSGPGVLGWPLPALWAGKRWESVWAQEELDGPLILLMAYLLETTL